MANGRRLARAPDVAEAVRSTDIVVVTGDADFVARVRRALGAYAAPRIRVDRDPDLGRGVHSVATPVGDALVVALGPDLPPDDALELARAVDQACPGAGVILVTKGSKRMLRSAFHVGVRDVLDPEATSVEIREAFERVLLSTARRRVAAAALTSAVSACTESAEVTELPVAVSRARDRDIADDALPADPWYPVVVDGDDRVVTAGSGGENAGGVLPETEVVPVGERRESETDDSEVAVVGRIVEVADVREGSEQRDAAVSAETRPRARVVSILCPKGGTGRTTVATNVAIGLAHAAPGQVVIVDLDVQFGDVASALRIVPDHTILDTTRTGPLDAPTVKACLAHHPADLYVLCAPRSPTGADHLTADHTQRLLELLAESFRFVVVDTSSGLDEHTMNAIELSTDLVVLSSTDVPSVRATQKEVEVLRVIGHDSQQWHFVLNRSDSRSGLHLAAIESSVGLEVDVAVPSSGAVPLALNQGTPILEADPRSPISVALAELVQRLMPGEPTTMVTNGNGRGSVFRRKR